MFSLRRLAPILALTSLICLALLAGTVNAGNADSCLIRSSQSRTQIEGTSIDGPTCSALAGALSQNGLQFSVAEPGTLESTPFSSLVCGVTFVDEHDIAQVHLGIYDPGNGTESRGLCQTFQ